MRQEIFDEIDRLKVKYPQHADVWRKLEEFMELTLVESGRRLVSKRKSKRSTKRRKK